MFGSKKFTTIAATALVLGMGFSTVGFADDDELKLTPQDAMVTTIFDKSYLVGEIRKDDNNNMVIYPGNDGVLNTADDQLLFDYTGDIYSIDTDDKTGELKKMERKIGWIKGTAAFPVGFAYLSGAFNALMELLLQGYTVPEAMGKLGMTDGLPPVLDWTCNSCEMKIGENFYVNIVNALTPGDQYYMEPLAQKFGGMLMGGAAGGMDSMRLSAKAYLGLTPASMDPNTKEMSIRMAGCSAVVAMSGPNGPVFEDGVMVAPPMMGTLCLNSTATFNVSATTPPTGIEGDVGPITNGSSITGSGSSNCVTVLHRPTM